MPTNALALHAVHKFKAPGRPYVFGRFHPDRFTLRGYLMELRVYLTSLKTRRKNGKFLIIARPRSGTTLLGRMLNQLDSLQCDPELLHYAVLSPYLMLNRLAAKSDAAAYGCKLLSYQLIEVHKRKDARSLLDALARSGFVFVHVVRDTFDQALSFSISLQSGRFVLKGENEHTTGERTFHIDPDEFEETLRWSVALLDYEKRLLDGLPHHTVSYDRDLKHETTHQATVDGVCGFLGVPSGPVRSDTLRTGGKLGVFRAENREELRAIYDRTCAG